MTFSALVVVDAVVVDGVFKSLYSFLSLFVVVILRSNNFFSWSLKLTLFLMLFRARCRRENLRQMQKEMAMRRKLMTVPKIPRISPKYQKVSELRISTWSTISGRIKLIFWVA